MKPSRLLTAGLLAGLCVSGSISAQEADTAPLAAAFEAALPALMEQYKVPAVSIAVIDDGSVVWSGAYGLADVENNTPATTETQFLVASLSKAVVSWAMTDLAAQGTVDLDAPVQGYLTSWQIPDSRYNADDITISRILSHTAGLSVDGYAGFAPDAELPTLPDFLNGEGGGRVFVMSTPGNRHSYSGGGYTVLQLMIEELTGQPFPDYMAENVFEPLGMTHSTYWLEEAEHLATGYNGAQTAQPVEVHLDQAAGGLYTTPTDLATLLAAEMPGGDEPAGRGILTPEQVAELFVPADVQNEQYARGMYIVPLENGSFAAWHDGIATSTRTLFVTLPESGDGLVIFTNSNQGHRLMEPLVCAWEAWVGATSAEELCKVF